MHFVGTEMMFSAWWYHKLDIEGQVLKILGSTWVSQVPTGALRNAYPATSIFYEGHKPVEDVSTYKIWTKMFRNAVIILTAIPQE